MDSPSKHPPFTFCIARWTAYHGPLGPTADPTVAAAREAAAKAEEAWKCQVTVSRVKSWFQKCSVSKTMPSTTHDWEWFMIYTTYKNGDDWGMVYYCFAKIGALYIIHHGKSCSPARKAEGFEPSRCSSLQFLTGKRIDLGNFFRMT